MDFYRLLGLSPDATPGQIKKAYRKLAKKYHPDLNQPESEKFKLITQAYQTLIDPEKRKAYDNRLQKNSGLKASLEKTLEKIFKYEIKKDVTITINLTLEEAYRGTVKTIRYKRFERCFKCDGSGITEDSKLERCAECNGTSYVKRFGLKIPCVSCKSKGFIIQNPCYLCDGNGIYENFTQKKIEIPAGIDEKDILMVKDAGNQDKNGETGDLYLKVRFYRHELFKKKNLDLYREVKVKKENLPLKISFYDLNGDLLSVKIPGDTENKAIFVIKGRGFRDRNGNFGDIYLKVYVV